MIILGIHLVTGSATAATPGHPGDASVALLVNNEVVALRTASPDPRDAGAPLPLGAIRHALSLITAHGGGVDAVAFSSTEADLASALGAGGHGVRHHIARVFDVEFGIDVGGRLVFSSPASVHALAAWFGTGRRDGLYLVPDGDGRCAAIARCGGPAPLILRTFSPGGAPDALLAMAADILAMRGRALPARLALDREALDSMPAKAFRSAYKLSDGGHFDVVEKAQFIYALRRELFAAGDNDRFAAGVVSGAVAAVIDILRHVVAACVDTGRDGALFLGGQPFADPLFAYGLAPLFPQLDIVALADAAPSGHAAAAAHLARAAVAEGVVAVGAAAGCNVADREERTVDDVLAGWSACIRHARHADPVRCAAGHLADGRAVAWSGPLDGDAGAEARGLLCGLDAGQGASQAGVAQLVAPLALLRPHLDLADRYTAHNLHRLAPAALATAGMDEELRRAVGQAGSILVLTDDDKSAWARIAGALGRAGRVPAFFLRAAYTASTASAAPTAAGLDDAIAALLLGEMDVLCWGAWEIRADQTALWADPAHSPRVAPTPGSALSTFDDGRGERQYELRRATGDAAVHTAMAISPALFHLLGGDREAGADVRDELAALRDAWTHGLVGLSPRRAPDALPFPHGG